MSLIKYVSVTETENGNRTIRPGKSDRDGTFVKIPTPENDRDDFERVEWERVDVFTLPEKMTKDDFKEWWNENVDSDTPPSPIPDVLDAMGR